MSYIGCGHAEEGTQEEGTHDGDVTFPNRAAVPNMEAMHGSTASLPRGYEATAPFATATNSRTNANKSRALANSLQQSQTTNDKLPRKSSAIIHMKKLDAIASQANDTEWKQILKKIFSIHEFGLSASKELHDW